MVKKRRIYAFNYLSRFIFLLITPVFFQYFALGFIWHSIYWGVITLVLLIWVFFILSSLLIGRVGCGWFCFMGTTYDCVSTFHSRKTKWREPILWLRLLLSFSFITSAFTFYFFNLKQGITHDFEVKPFFLKVNFDDHYKLVWVIDVLTASILALITNKRWGCKNMCVVGFLCSLTARYSRLLPVVDTNKCIHCGHCENECLTGIPITEYIKNNSGLVTNPECVMCGKCSSVCKSYAIEYKFVWNRKRYVTNHQKLQTYEN
ncbi:4Fe-4S binding protein [Parabacteroides sp. Marseille-P3160]|uniref:4Fe-4S binding protein n=1 Tax=Parabacteroides sp. Marseille-P3160 TaxID=1917887 RepID=UPI00135B4456|nr:4Fe-4S binding protein [Parabacteroides sp. Marseille-P3160]